MSKAPERVKVQSWYRDGEYWVVVRSIDSRTGKHVDRYGPFCEKEAHTRAKEYARIVNVYSVIVSEGSEYSPVYIKIK